MSKSAVNRHSAHIVPGDIGVEEEAAINIKADGLTALVADSVEHQVRWLQGRLYEMLGAAETLRDQISVLREARQMLELLWKITGHGSVHVEIDYSAMSPADLRHHMDDLRKDLAAIEVTPSPVPAVIPAEVEVTGD